MKLIRCYIDNFGTLSERKYDFSEGLNTVREDNGTGKSTLAAFIKAMLYGFPETKSPRLEENERRRFEPWSGGVFGGSLEFEANGTCYRIERTFGKRASEDCTRIFDTDTGKALQPIGEEIGCQILGIDREGFERTVFFSDKSFGEKIENPTVAAKLSDLSGVSFDMPSLQSALSLLDEQRKFYHRQGGAGAISDVMEKRAELEYKLRELDSLASTHENDGRRLAELKKQKAQLSENEKATRESLREDNIRVTLLEQYRDQEKRLSSELERLSALKQGFRGEAPEDDALSDLTLFERERDLLSEKLSSLNSSLPEMLERKARLELAEQELSDMHIRENNLQKMAGLCNTCDDKTKKSSSLPYLIISFAIVVISVLLGAAVSPIFYIASVTALAPILFYALSGKRKTFNGGEKGETEAELEGIRERAARTAEKLGLPYTGTDQLLESIKSELSDNIMWLEERSKCATRLTEISSKLFDSCSSFGASTLSELKARTSEYRAVKERIRALNENLSAFREKYRLDKSCGGGENAKCTLEGISKRLSEISAEESVLSRKFTADEDELEARDELIGELMLMQETEKKYRESLKTVKLAKEYLELARDRMNARYLEKTVSSFKKYAELISNETGDFGMDTSFVITKREGGRSHPRNAYSRGIRELYELALRFALTDSLYENERPFIILDDPFAYFDDTKLARAKKLLASLSRDRQIIYLSPSEYRCVRGADNS